MKLATDGYEASRGPSATTELLVVTLNVKTSVNKRPYSYGEMHFIHSIKVGLRVVPRAVPSRV